MISECLAEKIVNWLLLPFILIWNILVTAFIIMAFIGWWSFLFGSVVAIILVLIFAAELLFLPIGIANFYIPFFAYSKECEENEKQLVKRVLTKKEEHTLFLEKMRRGELTESDIDDFINED